MSEFEIEYGDVYSATSIYKQSSLSNRKNFLFKVIRYTGDYFMISNTSLESLSDLYEKIKRGNALGFSYKAEIAIRDLFVKCEKTISLKSIPNSKDISITDFIQLNPDYFIPDKCSHILKIYYIYLVDDEAINYMKSFRAERTIWHEFLGIIYRHTSCFKKTVMFD
jgi:hypothetical protein